MATNALARRWEFDVPNVNNLLQPIQQGIARADRLRQQDVENRRADEQMGMQRERFDLEKRRMAKADEAAEAQRIGGIARVIDGERDPTRRAAMIQHLYKGSPSMVAALQKYGVDPSDHVNVPKFLMAQAGGYDPLAERKSRAEIARIEASTNLAGAQAGYYRSRAQPAATQPAAGVDPQAGYGLNERDEIVGPGVGAPAPALPQGENFQALPPPDMSRMPTAAGAGVNILPPPQPSALPPPMRLGGPKEGDWVDMGGGVSIQRPRQQQQQQQYGYTPDPGGSPSIVDVARQRAYGPAGITSPQVQGIVTDAGRNRRTDAPATREMQGQRAMTEATPEQRDRLMRFRNTQQIWGYTYGRPPRAGYYYGEDGRELPLTDKNYKGDRESQAVALMNMNKIEQASKKLLEYSYLTRTALGALNVGEAGQAFADMKQGALGIAYALSGKQVSVAEMKNFIEAYGPVPGDSAERIQNKTQRMRQFYEALLTASRGGEPYERAFARALASTGIRNPDGSPSTAPAAASGGARPAAPANPRAGVRGMTTDELIRSLNGGR